MTNEEKAREIIGGDCKKENCLQCGGSLSVDVGCVQYRKIMEMAAWKERQMIKKCIEWLKDIDRRHAVRNFHTGEYYSIQDMIEDFKTYMEE